MSENQQQTKQAAAWTEPEAPWSGVRIGEE